MERLQDLRGVAFAGGLGPGGLHHTLGVDQHRAAHDPFELLAYIFFVPQAS